MRSIKLISRQNPRKRQLLPEPPREVPRSIPPLEAPVNCKSRRRLSPASFASTARQGGCHLTHNTKECRRYNGMGNLFSLFQTKPAEAKKPAKKGGDKQMAYLLATVEILVKKGLNKAMKGKRCKRNHAYDSSSSDSNSK